ncbi:MAG TPA: hypothetical protein V6D27_11790 [Vampirovibrionales bacterium]
MAETATFVTTFVMTSARVRSGQKPPTLHNFSTVLSEKATVVALCVATIPGSFISESLDILNDASKFQKFLVVSSNPKF